MEAESYFAGPAVGKTPFYEGRKLVFQGKQAVPVQFRKGKTPVAGKSATIGLHHNHLFGAQSGQLSQALIQSHLFETAYGKDGYCLIQGQNS
jgi:hypothetical protein